MYPNYVQPFDLQAFPLSKLLLVCFVLGVCSLVGGMPTDDEAAVVDSDVENSFAQVTPSLSFMFHFTKYLPSTPKNFGMLLIAEISNRKIHFLCDSDM